MVVCTFSLVACIALPGDPMPRPVGIGRADDGRIRFIVALCAGERLSSFQVTDHQTEQLIWAVSRPVDAMGKGRQITLGDVRGFEALEVPLPPELPENIDATARLADGRSFGSAFVITEISPDLAGAQRVLGIERVEISENEFFEEIDDGFC
ncbi:hypothetical protein [Sphaerisporangium corydalis]|uniref:Uncharacterized protein n=1 Tax=Sphaerisporangium corydalis TaxID=1441875 RepID=A0ABV9EC79_9ACTN|nr:hypothetical protein [Sphaerisporangium corydalis]